MHFEHCRCLGGRAADQLNTPARVCGTAGNIPLAYDDGMAQQFDVSLKALFRHSRGVMTRALFGGPVSEWLNVEQPDVRNPRADLLARGPDGKLRHVELQSRNDPEMGFRELDYYVGFRRLLKEHVEQIVLYAGREPLNMTPAFESPSTEHRFRILDLREMDGEDLLLSDDWGDNALALLTQANRERVIQAVEKRLWSLEGDEQQAVARTFVLISGILGIEEEIGRRLEADMIDIMENKVLGPAIRQGIEQGIEQGRREGIEMGVEEGMRQALKVIVKSRFGSVPRWASALIEGSNQEEIQELIAGASSAPTLEDLFR
jgi:predicted transposase/invertase (TIGR01784 family)